MTQILIVKEKKENRKKSEKALREEREKYWNLFNSAAVGMFRSRLDGSEILDMNDQFLAVFDLTRKEMTKNPLTMHWVCN